ncbi:MAG TPA: RNase adapter RapZ, partial [Ilumatobacter sp.]
MVEIAVLTGLSGAGRSAAAAVLEDLGFYVVDNLPTSLLPTIVDLASQPGGIDRLALVSGRRHDELLPHVARMRADGHRVTIVYLDASTPVLVQRYDATRRKHPLSDEAGGLLEAIELERTMLNPLKEHADLVIDSSELNVHQLKERLVSVFEREGSTQLQIAVESFGYKNGLPLDADI